MKRIIKIMMTICFCFLLVACGNQQVDNSTSSISTDSSSEMNTVTISDTESQNKEVDAVGEIEEVAETTADVETSETKTLVVYFSNTGNTKAIAESIAEGVSADLYEIVAEVPYTEADLDYHDDNSRTTKERDDASVRPAIVGSVENMEQYDTIYIGYPIWWGEAPRILDTFVESYDFTGKTVIPFCTSINTGIGSSGEILEDLAGSGSWMEGKRFTGSEADTEVMDWVNSL